VMRARARGEAICFISSGVMVMTLGRLQATSLPSVEFCRHQLGRQRLAVTAA
jgi:hypothetical protein